MRDLLDDAPISSTRHTFREVYEAGPEARELWREVQQHDWDEMPMPLFKVVAAELAARARVLQGRGEAAELIPERVIKRLTAVAANRGAKGIYGLARHHEANWEDLVQRARAERERLEIGARGLTQRIAIPARTTKTAKAGSATRDKDEADDDPPPESPAFPRLREAACRRPVVLLGGIAKQPKLLALQEPPRPQPAGGARYPGSRRRAGPISPSQHARTRAAAGGLALGAA